MFVNGVLLGFKSIDISNSRVIYRIYAGGIRGFQYGDPMAAPYFVEIDLFDGADWHYKLVIEWEK